MIANTSFLSQAIVRIARRDEFLTVNQVEIQQTFLCFCCYFSCVWHHTGRLDSFIHFLFAKTNRSSQFKTLTLFNGRNVHNYSKENDKSNI
jgi:hypothetical protein